MTKKCVYCGNEFKVRRSDHKYCSARCRRSDYYQRNREKHLAHCKKYREEHRDYYKNYYKEYYQNHKEYFKRYQTEKPKYPCYRYSRPENIPDEWCLSCPVPKCRYEYD